jgi:hypothetical protein
MKMFDIHETIKGVSMKGPMENNLKHCKCEIRNNITINSVIGWQWQHGFHDE